MHAIQLRTEHMQSPLGIDIVRPCLSWICKDGITQTAYEISATEDDTEIWNTGKVKSSKMYTYYERKLTSRQRVEWKVRLWDEEDNPGEWSDCAVFEMGLLQPEQFQAKWINPELALISDEHQPASYLKKIFCADSGQRSRLYITCHGLYEAYLNGIRVGDFVLAPGTGSYGKKLSYQTYDVTGLLQQGDNEIQVILGDGWYRGCSGVDGVRNLYGSDLSLFCQLEVDGKIVCISDETWQASQCGAIRENDMQQGERYDARMEEITDWHEVKTEEFGTSNLACSNSVPIQEWEQFTGTIMETPNKERVIDFGQNLAGYVEFTVNAHAGDKIILHHGEALDENGNFTNANFQPGERHQEGGIQQKIEYICKEGVNHYKPRFSIFGFQYAKIETEIDLENAVFTAHAVYSQMEETGVFTCSDKDVEQLVKNSIWSQKSNFCDIPTDCPTRERAGWTGDAGGFVDTGLYLADCYPVFRKWLAECRLIQKEDGRVYNIAPPNGIPGMYTEILSGSVGWGDACIIVPYALYKRYDDITILEENYQMMKQWMAYLENRAKQPGKSAETQENPYEEYTVNTGVDYGEWNEPGAGLTGVSVDGATPVGKAYLSYSCRLLAEIADILGDSEAAAHYRTTSEKAKKAYRHTGTADGRIISTHQCEYVRALAFGLLDQTESEQAAADLNELVIQNDYHLNTGFLATPFLCEVLTDYGYLETAYRLLLQDTAPGWLYAVKKGANTIWETWDGIREDGTVHDSLNHYAYGVISGWLFKNVCGIHLENGSLSLTPTPFSLLQNAKAVYHSPLGTVESGWIYQEDGSLQYQFEIPPNLCARVILPDGRDVRLSAGRHCL